MGWLLRALIAAIGAATFACWLLAQEPKGNLVFNGDFELSEPNEQHEKGPPPGWAIWGREDTKDPRHYTRDTRFPHSGQGCFRIYNPANLTNYIVTDPSHAIRPQKNKAYRIRFWARADKEGACRFGVIGYQTIHPFTDAPPVMFQVIFVSPQWQAFEFEVHEGRDFDADKLRYMLLLFDAAYIDSEERTLWIDDVVVTEEPLKRPYNLLFWEKMPPDPIEHRLAPSETLQLKVTVDITKRLRPTVKQAAGISMHRLVGWTGHPYDRQGNYTLDKISFEEAIRDLRLPMSRVYGVGHEPPWWRDHKFRPELRPQPRWTIEEAMDRLAEVCRRCNIPQEWMVVELEVQDASHKLPPEVWAQAVRYSRQKGYRFRFWEIANEPYNTAPAFPTPDDYVAHVKAVTAAIKRVDPRAQTGIGIREDHFAKIILLGAAM